MDVDSGEVVGEHAGIHYWTVGQHCPNGYFVVDKDEKNVVFVVRIRKLLFASAWYIEEVNTYYFFVYLENK